MNWLDIVVFGAIGTLVGYFYNSMADKVKRLEKKLNEKPVDLGVTSGAYTPPKVSNTSEIGISEPKSPQLVAWEASQALQEAQLHVNVKPK